MLRARNISETEVEILADQFYEYARSRLVMAIESLIQNVVEALDGPSTNGRLGVLS